MLCVYVDSQRTSWSKRTEARVRSERTNEGTNTSLDLPNLYIDCEFLGKLLSSPVHLDLKLVIISVREMFKMVDV